MGASVLPYALQNEQAVGKGHPTKPDVVNRTIRAILAASGQNPDAPFTGLRKVFSVQAYGAKNDGLGTTDDGIPINLAIAAAKAAGGGVVYMPGGGAGYNINTPINMANLGTGSPVALAGDGGINNVGLSVGTTLIGNCTSAVIDTQGSEAVTLEQFRIRCPNTVARPTKVGINCGRTLTNPGANFHHYRRITIDMDVFNEASARGNVGIYNIGAENMFLDQVQILACQPLFLSTTDDLGLPGPWGGTHNGISMTFVSMVQNVYRCLSGLAASSSVEVGAGAWNIFLNDLITDRAVGGAALYPLVLRNGAFNVYWEHGQIESWPAVVAFDGDSDGNYFDLEISLPTQGLINFNAAGKTLKNSHIRIQQPNGTLQSLFDVAAAATIESCDVELRAGQIINAPSVVISGGTVRMADTTSSVAVSGASNFKLLSPGTEGISADRGDASVSVTVGVDRETQLFATALTLDRDCLITLSYVYNGAHFRVVRTGLGAGNLNIKANGGTILKTLAAATKAYADVTYVTGVGFVLTGYGTL